MGIAFDMYQRAYWDIQKVLDSALGTGEDDGAGEGIVADVRLLAYRYTAAIRELREQGLGDIADEIAAAQMPDPFESPEHCGYTLVHPMHFWVKLANDERPADEDALCPGGGAQ